MTKFGIIGATALVLAAAATWGCAVDVDTEEVGDVESIDTEEQAVGLISSRWDPDGCNGARGQCNGMHCCGVGEAMTGVHIGENDFQCRRLAGGNDAGCQPMPLQARSNPTEGVAVGACPVGQYMKGYHAGSNWATCCPYPAGNFATSLSLDGHGESVTQAIAPRHKPPWFWAGVCSGLSTHVCPANSVMEGIHAGSNYLLCGT